MRRHALFIGLFVFVAAARFAILFASQTHVHSDEAIIGLMGKHILEGRHFPFYMYGQPYNAGAAWEAYLASVAFALFGVGVVPLKGCIVVLSLLCLFLFYRMGCALYDQRTALFATVAFGLSIWCLELAVPLVAALWLLLILRRRISFGSAPAVLIGFLLGYAPVIVFNLIYRFSNWRYVVIERPGGGFSGLLQLSNWRRIFLDEMPKFFGPHTALWYYAEKPAAGYVFYAIALLALGMGVWPFVTSPGKILRAMRGDLADARQKSDFNMVVLTAASFVPYVSQAPGVPSYFFGGCFFLSMLT